jgi:hypothetical protein
VRRPDGRATPPWPSASQTLTSHILQQLVSGELVIRPVGVGPVLLDAILAEFALTRFQRPGSTGDHILRGPGRRALPCFSRVRPEAPVSSFGQLRRSATNSLRCCLTTVGSCLPLLSFSVASTFWLIWRSNFSRVLKTEARACAHVREALDFRQPVPPTSQQESQHARQHGSPDDHCSRSLTPAT